MLCLSPTPHLVSLPHLQPAAVLLQNERVVPEIYVCPLERKGCGFASRTHGGTQAQVFAALKVDCGYSLHFLPHLPSNLGISSKKKFFTQS